MKVKILAVATLAAIATHTALAGTMKVLVPYPVPTESEQRHMAMHSFCISTTTTTYKFNDISSRENEGWKRVTLGDGMTLPPNYVGEWKAYLPAGKEVMAVIDDETMMVPMKIAHPCYVKLRDSE